MKKFLLLAALACGSLSAMADVTVTLRGCVQVQDGEGNFDVMFNDTEADSEGKTSRRDLQFEIVFPEGLQLANQGTSRNPIYFKGDDDEVTGALVKHQIGWNKIDGVYRLVINTMGGDNGEGIHLYNGRLCSFKVTVDSEFTKADFEVKNITVTTDNNGESVKPADVNAFAVPVKIINTVATIVAPYDIALPAGVMAEEGTDNGSVVTVDENKATSTLAAGVPSFIFGAKVEDTYYYGVQSVEKPIKGNVLTGTFADQKISSGYVLQGDKLRNVNVEVTLPAYKAYIAEGAGVKEFSLNGVTTGITVNEAINGEQVIYNVAGQRLNKTQKGVNIVNGKKYIVK